MAKVEAWYQQDLKKPVPVRYLDGSFFNEDAAGSRIGVLVYSDGEAVTLAGSITGYCVRADGTTVPISGTRTSNKAYIDVPQSALSVPGPLTVTIKNTESSVITTLCAVVGIVTQSRTGVQVDPGQTVTDWTNQISAQLQACQTAADNLGSTLAVPYASLTFPVAAGTYTVYNGNVYRANQDISTSEDWTAAHWTQVKVCNEIRDLKSAIEREEYTANEMAMEYNEPYSSDDFIIPVTGSTMSISEKQISLSNTNATDSTYTGFLSKRDYLNFDTNGYFILAYAKPDWAEKYYALAVVASSGGLRSMVVNGTTIRSYDQSLSVGTDESKIIRAYRKGSKIIIYLQGQKNVVNLSDYPIIPTDTSKGYWSDADFTFGLAMVGTSKTFDYSSGNMLRFGGPISSSYTAWGSLEADKYYAVPPDNSNLPALFAQYGVDRGILEVFSGHISTVKLMRFTSGSANAQFEAMYDNGTLSKWRLSYAEDRKSNSNPDYSALRYMGAITDSMDKAQRVGTYNVTSTTTLPSAFTDKGIVSGMLIVVNGFADSNLWVLQIFISNNREYIFTRYGEVNISSDTFTSTSTWKLMAQPDSIKTGFSGTVYYALGDSITAGSFSKDDGTAEAATNAAWAYCKKISNMIGGTLHNIAVPGATSASVLSDQVSLVDDDATLITIMCGTGDYRDNLTLGTYNDTTAGTTCGNLYQIISQLMETAPQARIIVLSPPLAGNKNNPGETRRNTNNTAGWNYNDLLTQYSALCKKYGIEFVDVLDNSPINSFNLLTMCKDGTHPTKDAYTPLAQYIFGQIV